MTLRVSLLLVAITLVACGNPAPQEGQAREKSEVATARAGELVTPPFRVEGELEGLLLVWYDAQGPHTASRRSEIPEPSRELVRIDSLEVSPEQRLDADHVYVADLRAPQTSGAYRVEKWERDAFEARVAPRPEIKNEAPAVADAKAPVIIYGASWCGACKQAAQFLGSRGITFVEKDIEKEPGAREEMLEKARKQGVTTRGIPVIDVRGKLLPGFDPRAVMQALGDPV